MGGVRSVTRAATATTPTGGTEQGDSMTADDHQIANSVDVLVAAQRELDALSSGASTPQSAIRLKNLAILVDWVTKQWTRAERRGRVEPMLSAAMRQPGGLPNGRHDCWSGDDVLHTAIRLTRESATGSHDATGVLRRMIGALLTVEGLGDGVEPPASTETSDRTLTPDEVAAYLQDRFDDPDAVVHDVIYVHGGFAKHTIIVPCVLRNEAIEIVLRQVPSGRPTSTLAPEFDVVRFGHASDLPVPEPLWIEPEQNRLGGPFFATRRSPGSNIGDVWGARTVPSTVCAEFAEVLSRLHSLDVAALPDAPVLPMSTRPEIDVAISQQEERAAASGSEREPVLQALFAWLRAHVPDSPKRPTLVHGDAAFSNLLVADGTLTTLLDWERSHVGDPAEDLAYLRPSIEPHMPWSEFLDAYVSAGGRPPDPSSEMFYTVWKDVWRHVSCLTMVVHFGTTHRYASAVAGFVHGPRFLDAAARTAFDPDFPSIE
jgi:aminoglycoside phosphotransferase (APT) family kinase protein